jgi:hypothetical protein
MAMDNESRAVRLIRGFYRMSDDGGEEEEEKQSYTIGGQFKIMMAR